MPGAELQSERQTQEARRWGFQNKSVSGKAGERSGLAE